MDDIEFQDYLKRIDKITARIASFKDGGNCPEKAKGHLANLLGELYSFRREMVQPQIKLDEGLAEMVQEYKNDKFIRAYIEQRNDWNNKISDLQKEIRSLRNREYEDDEYD